VVGGSDSENNYLSTAVSLDVGNFLVPCLPQVPSISELEHPHRKAALEKWVAQVTTMKREHLARAEEAIVCVNKENTAARQELDAKRKALDEEEGVLEKRYREKLEKLDMVTEKWVDGVEEKLKDVEERMEGLEERVVGAKRKSVESEKDGKSRSDPDRKR